MFNGFLGSGNPPPPGDKSHIIIGVMGATGSGKSTFINRLSGSELPVGMGLESCTDKVDVSKPFLHGKRWVTLVDTPGFDDTGKSDSDILTLIASYLETSYRHGIKLAGLVYIHRISDIRMGGTSVRNFRMFRDLCGHDSLKNVIVATNMWELSPADVCELREKQLRDRFFKPVVDMGGQLIRLYNTDDSAKAIIQCIANNHPLPLKIQSELVDEHKSIRETAAGAALVAETEKKLEKRFAELEAASKAAMEEKDKDFKRMLEEERKRHEEGIAELQRANASLESSYKAAVSRTDDGGQCRIF